MIKFITSKNWLCVKKLSFVPSVAKNIDKLITGETKSAPIAVSQQKFAQCAEKNSNLSIEKRGVAHTVAVQNYATAKTE